ncbi:ABC transporter permease [Vitreoscilla sp. C1]|uniref:aliphatic sulfonate ABC transporter permease SsuC n=1 Tax=Vitreoscilla sp. (strain C1) TaxID=96942 RepID=UPI000CDCA966|nr:aliphatic sulfonate ABC transporter permease SsuC [Vitreoscilla sp. C1]AUZ05785.1 ABC transporter permease [Vitreoscilla sp. C1]
MAQLKAKTLPVVRPQARGVLKSILFKHQQKWLPWLLPLTLLLVWQAMSVWHWLPEQYLRNVSSPLAVAQAGWALAVNGELWVHLGISAARALTGLFIGGVTGLALGVATGLSPTVRTLLDTTLQMLRNIPNLALIPLVILWFGIDEAAKLCLVALGTFFPIYLNTFHGIRNADAALIEMAKSYGLSGWALFKEVILPGALPSVLVGLRFSLGIMWLTLIVAETISATSGIGYLAMHAREFFQTDIIIFTILVYALLGFVADWIARQLERVLLRWHPAYVVKQGDKA